MQVKARSARGRAGQYRAPVQAPSIGCPGAAIKSKGVELVAFRERSGVGAACGEDHRAALNNLRVLSYNDFPHSVKLLVGLLTVLGRVNPLASGTSLPVFCSRLDRAQVLH